MKVPRSVKGLTSEDFLKKDLEECWPKWFIKLTRKLYSLPHLDGFNSDSMWWGSGLTNREEGTISLAFVADDGEELEQFIIKAREICKKWHANIKKEELDTSLQKWTVTVGLDKLTYFSKHGYGRRKRGQRKQAYRVET